MEYNWQFSRKSNCSDEEKHECMKLVAELIDLSKVARRNGLLSLVPYAENSSSFLLRKGLQLVVDGEQRKMRPGDMQLIRRVQFHAFSTKTGCVFEEISTRHNKGDSIYEDQAIARLDPIQRKTVVEEW